MSQQDCRELKPGDDIRPTEDKKEIQQEAPKVIPITTIKRGKDEG